MQKTFVFLCSEASKRIALTALASDAHEQYNIVVVDSINAEQILADNTPCHNNAIIAVCLGGKSGGRKAVQLATLLKDKGVRAALVASLPFKNEGIERNHRAMIDYLEIINHSCVQTVIKNDCVTDPNVELSLSDLFDHLNQVFFTAIISTKILVDEIQ